MKEIKRKKFNAIVREALWETYNKRCFYCDSPLSFIDLEVEHLRPLASFSEAKGTVEDPNDFENLVPAHANCNGRKGNAEFTENALHFFTELSKRHQSKLLSEISRIKQRNDKDRTLARLSSAYFQGAVSLKEIQSVLSQQPREPDPLPAVEVSQKRFDEPLLPREHGLEFLTLVNDDGSEKRVTSLREWACALKEGYYPQSTYDIKESSIFEVEYSLMVALQRRIPPLRSFIANPRLGLSDLQLFPLTLLPDLEGTQLTQRLERRGVTLPRLIEKGWVKICDAGHDHLTLEYKGMGASYWEILRGDLSHSGREEILIGYYEYALGGTYGSGSSLILTRTSSREKFSLIHVPDLSPQTVNGTEE